MAARNRRRFGRIIRAGPFSKGQNFWIVRKHDLLSSVSSDSDFELCSN